MSGARARQIWLRGGPDAPQLRILAAAVAAAAAAASRRAIAAANSLCSESSRALAFTIPPRPFLRRPVSLRCLTWYHRSDQP